MAGEQGGKGQEQLVASCRATLHACLRTATLRNDFEGQAVLINCLLRNYLHYNLYNQADKLVLKSTFPEQASNNEWVPLLVLFWSPLGPPFAQNWVPFLNILGPLLNWAQCARIFTKKSPDEELGTLPPLILNLRSNGGDGLWRYCNYIRQENSMSRPNPLCKIASLPHS